MFLENGCQWLYKHCKSHSTLTPNSKWPCFDECFYNYICLGFNLICAGKKTWFYSVWAAFMTKENFEVFWSFHGKKFALFSWLSLVWRWCFIFLPCLLFSLCSVLRQPWFKAGLLERDLHTAQPYSHYVQSCQFIFYSLRSSRMLVEARDCFILNWKKTNKQ